MCTPVILDTDIGGDIDDTWALAMLLKSPELDVQLIVSDTGDTVYRAKIIARMLEIAGRTDIPVGIGIRQGGNVRPQAPWVEHYEVASYPGTVHEDGVQAIIETIHKSVQPVTLICIGPVPNIAEALRQAPEIAQKARFVGMHGSLYWSHVNQKQIPENNVAKDIMACQVVFRAPWLERIITPLDSCGDIVLEGERYSRLQENPDPVLAAVLENYEIWKECKNWAIAPGRSSILFDTVAVYLAFTTDYCDMRHMKLTVTDDGYTQIDENGVDIEVAINWHDKEAYLDFLAKRLRSPVVTKQTETSATA